MVNPSGQSKIREKPMPSTNVKKRVVYVTANKYQKEIILLAFIPAVLVFLSFIAIVFIGNVLLGNPVILERLFHSSHSEITPNQFSEMIVFLMCSFFILSLFVAFIISNNMVGAFGRIIRELDDVLAGRSQKTISSRTKDTLSKDLLKRINKLIEYYVEHQKKNP